VGNNTVLCALGVRYKFGTGSKDVWSNHSRPENKGLGAAAGRLLYCTAFMRFHGPKALKDN
jgi:hypothetical protein